jgi:hypothetical protein
LRKALNENPLVQIGVLAVLAIGVVFLLLTRMGGGGEDAPATSATGAPADGAATTTPAATPAAPAPATDEVTPSAPAAPTTPAPGETGTTAPESTAPADAGTFTAGPGLPEPVVKAYDDGKAVVLLVYRRKGIDDAFVHTFVRLLQASNVPAVSSAAVFRTNAHDIARYSRITQGVNVSRTPALVVIRPEKFSEGGMPLATVSYGFRGPQSVVQAVEDSLYEGPQIPVYPK